LGLAELPSAERGRRCAEYVRRAREAVGEGQRAGQRPGVLLRGLAEALDRLLRALCLGGASGDGGGWSLVALGGYGRQELFPYSDADLLLLQDGADDETCQGLVEQVIYPLWDSGVSVGHAVRSRGETLELAAADLTVCTSLLDARLVAGDREPFDALRAEARQQLFGPVSGRFVEQLREERRQRHLRFGETVYLLEPNIKSGKGGLRDLNTGLWAARARLELRELPQLAGSPAATSRQARTLVEAQRFLRSLRLAMHLHAGRAQDQLIFELQEALAPRLFPEEPLPGERRRGGQAVAPAVERLMHAFYRHAWAVVLETDGVLERLALLDAPETEGDRRPATDLEDEHLVLCGRRIHSMEPERFWQRPADALRAFAVARELGRSLDRPTRDAIAEAVAGQPGLQLMADAEAAELFWDLLEHPEDGKRRSVLEQMHDLGIVAAVVPEFEPCTGRVQHDLFHVYTVDRHSLYVVDRLKRWLRGEDDQRCPMAVELLQRLDDLGTLLLAALLHDAAKPMGSHHERRGARLAAGVAARLGLSVEQQQEVRFLVRHHLTMAHLSQKRDLSDPAVIGGFARQVQDVGRLRKLYLLTAADTEMTAPGNLTDWKARLLEELYVKTYIHLTLGEKVSAKQRELELEDRRAVLELALRRRTPQPEALVARLPGDMLLAHEMTDLVHHLEPYLELGHQPEATLRSRIRRLAGGTTELTVCCPDSPGLLATITGVMLAHGVEVLAAQVYTLETPPGTDAEWSGLALDIFSVRTGEGVDPWPGFLRQLEQALLGQLSVDQLVSRHTRPSGLPARVLPRVSTEVLVDNESSDRFSVLEVQTADRPGVLHAITRTLDRLGLGIHLSKVVSEVGRVVDIFYINERDGGGKVAGVEAVERLRSSVRLALEALPGDRPAPGRAQTER
jgi:[protein-PII] uridylyltransferase